MQSKASFVCYAGRSNYVYERMIGIDTITIQVSPPFGLFLTRGETLTHPLKTNSKLLIGRELSLQFCRWHCLKVQKGRALT